MDFFETIKNRRSVRAFIDRPVEPDKLVKILETVNRAPSAGNLQAFEIYVIKEKLKREQLAQAALDQDFIAQAPLALVFCANSVRSQGRYGQRGVNLYCLQDATIACSFAMMAATALGLGSVWVGAFHEERVQSIIGASEDHRPLAILPLGYAAESPPLRSRRSLDELVHEGL